MDELVSLCKRRGFIFQSGELYGGLKGMYDFLQKEYKKSQIKREMLKEKIDRLRIK